MQARHCTFVKSGPPTANPSSVSHWQQLWRTRLLHVLQSPYVSNLSTAQTKCDGLTLSTGRDHAARHACFIVNNYFEISAFFPFVLPQGTRLCNSVTTWRISKPSVHKDCPHPGWKHTGKKEKVELWRRAGPHYWDFMCLDFVPRTRQDFPFGLLLPCPHEAQHTRLSYSKRHFPDGSHFHSYHIWGRKYWGRQLLSDRIARDAPLPVTPMKEHSRPALSLNHCIARSLTKLDQPPAKPTSHYVARGRVKNSLRWKSVPRDLNILRLKWKQEKKKKKKIVN